MTQAGHAKFGRDILLGGWDNHAPGLSTQVNGERYPTRRGRRHATILYAYRRAWDPQVPRGDLTSPCPSIRRPARALPWSIKSLWERRGEMD